MSAPPNIEIKVVTQYVEDQSEPREERFVFAYHIQITNVSGKTCQLMSRHWLINDGTGGVEEVRGEGVVGKQPRLEQGQTFSYTSGAILKTPVGTMHGEYEFIDEDGETFVVDIPMFSLSVPNIVH